MADFQATQMEVTNELTPEDNPVVIVDPTTPSQKATVTPSGELKVLVSGGGSAGQLVQDGDVVNVSDIGRIFVGSDGSNYRFVATDAQGHLQVDVLSGAGGGTLVTDGQAIVSGETAVIFAGTDGSNFRHLSVDSAGQLQIDVISSALPTGAATEATLAGLLTEATFAAEDFATQTTLAALLTELQAKADLTETQPVDVVDRAVRDLGKVDIAAFDVSLPAGTNNIGDVDIASDLPLEHGTDSIRLGDGTTLVDVLDDSGTGRLQVEAKIASGGATQAVRVVDGNGDAVDVVNGASIPAGVDSGLMIAGPDLANVGRTVTVTNDTEDGKNRLEIAGKISVSLPEPPPAATAVTIPADTPLDVSSSETTNFTIPNGVTFTLSQIVAGAEGDPNEKGSKVEVNYVDASSVVHLISRLYISGFSTEIFPNTSTARDGTAMAGNGTTTQIRVIRSRLGGAALEIDCVVRGFYE